MNKEVSFDDLKRFSGVFAAGPANRIAMNAVTANGINGSAMNCSASQIHQRAFSIELESGDVCDQKKSGRCWMFASLNAMRLEVMNKLDLRNMELSQSYTLFYDKIEKSNWFLENILETLEEPLNGRLLSFLLSDPVGDGGQWDMFRSLIAKYGVVPKDVFPESEVSSNTHELHEWLTRKLRGYACELRTLHEAGEDAETLRGRKEAMMETVYRMLAISLGQPPERFTWETRDKKNGFVRVADITPQDFFKEYVGWNLDDFVTVINAPTEDKPFHRTFTVQYLGNVKDAAYPVKYLNLPVEDLKALVVAQLKDGRAVWFGCDSGQFSNNKAGCFSFDVMDVGSLFSTDFPMTKAQRLDFGESLMTHAMVFTGVDLSEDGRPVRWKVENSWGKDAGKDGYFVMTDDWFSEYVYQILLEKKYFSAQQAAEYETEPIILQPWDPMGSLA